MKLLETQYKDNFEKTLKGWSDEIHRFNDNALFHVYIPYNCECGKDSLKSIRAAIKSAAPDIPVIGCSSNGEIFGGKINDNNIIITLTLFEKETTKIETYTSYENDEVFEAQKLFEHVMTIPDLKGIEILTAASYDRLEKVGSIIDRIPEDIEVFGGVAVGDDAHPAYVFANDNPISSEHSAFVVYSGPELHLKVNRMFGWKPIGYPLKVTRSKGTVVYEIDGKPAYDVYNHYLRIRKGNNFFYDALQFPWEVRLNEDTAYLRHAKSVNDDGSIIMSSNIPEGSNMRLTFGDPIRIIEHTKQTTLQIRDFGPQVVNIINCMGRKLFWSEKENIEIDFLSSHMNSTGFSALGEIMRYKGVTLLNNLSIVTVAMREGPAGPPIEYLDVETIDSSSSMPITARLAIFINTITSELMEKNDQLNDMLHKASHDAMTGLLNRGAIERKIYETNEADTSEGGSNWHLIMFDVDNFKQINDSCGHVMGDDILKLIAKVLSEYIYSIPGAETGRWGGEEFMILLHGRSDDEAKEIAEKILNGVRDYSASEISVTISVGVTKHRTSESILQTIKRVDDLMYTAKNNGKDQVCSDI